MKKTLLVSAAALSVMTMAAQNEVVQTWDFYSHGIFAEFTNPESENHVEGSYQFVDKGGKTIKGGEMMINALKLTNTDGKAYYQQHGVNNRVISLYDGQTYAMSTDKYYKFVFKEGVNAQDEWPSDTPCGEYVLTDDGEEGYQNGTMADPYKFTLGEEVEPGVFTDDSREPLGAEYAAKLAANPFIGWEQDTPDYNAMGPVRAMWDSAKGTLDATWADGSWRIANEADYIPAKASFDFNRSQQATGCRKDTYIQFPEVQGPCEVTYYIADDLGNKYSKELAMKVTPVVNGAPVAELAQTTSVTEGVTPKRFYKFTYKYEAANMVAIRMSCVGHEVSLLQATIKSQPAGVDNVLVDAIDENAPVYNVFGQRVDDSYKGIVIKGGKKYIQK